MNHRRQSSSIVTSQSEYEVIFSCKQRYLHIDFILLPIPDLVLIVETSETPEKTVFNHELFERMESNFPNKR